MSIDRSSALTTFSPFSPSAWRSEFVAAGPVSVVVLLVSVSGAVFEHREAESVLSGALNPSILVRACLVAVAGGLLAVMARGLRLRFGLWFLLFASYAAICCISTLWSSSPLVTFGKSVELMVGVLAVAYAAGRGSRGATLESLSKLVLYLMSAQVTVVTIGFLLRFPGFYQRGSGGLTDLLGLRSVSPFMSANTVGYFSAILLVSVFALWRSGRLSSVAFAGWSAWFALTLFCSGSRTSLALTIGAVTLVSISRLPRAMSLVAVLLSSLGLYLIWGDLITFLQGDVPDWAFWSLTGRTILWQAALDSIQDNPLIGAGFGIGSRVLFASFDLRGFDETISTIHNGFLEVLLGVGIIGLVPWALSLFGALRAALRERVSGGQLSIVAPYVVIVLVGTTIMSSGLGSRMSPSLMLMLILLAWFGRASGEPANELASRPPAQQSLQL